LESGPEHAFHDHDPRIEDIDGHSDGQEGEKTFKEDLAEGFKRLIHIEAILLESHYENQLKANKKQTL
jgi:hypothetical protein